MSLAEHLEVIGARDLLVAEFGVAIRAVLFAVVGHAGWLFISEQSLWGVFSTTTTLGAAVLFVVANLTFVIGALLDSNWFWQSKAVVDAADGKDTEGD